MDSVCLEVGLKQKRPVFHRNASGFLLNLSFPAVICLQPERKGCYLRVSVIPSMSGAQL